MDGEVVSVRFGVPDWTLLLRRLDGRSDALARLWFLLASGGWRGRAWRSSVCGSGSAAGTWIGAQVYGLHMSRTNIEIDDDLVARAMEKYGLPTKRSAVELALQRLVGPPLSGAALADFLDDISGSGWIGDESASGDDVRDT